MSESGSEIVCCQCGAVNKWSENKTVETELFGRLVGYAETKP